MNGNYHHPYEDAEGASYLYWVGDDADTSAFHDYFKAHPRAIDLWLGSHTHAHPDDRYGHKEMVAQHWGVTFANVGAMTRYHGRESRRWWPSSGLLSFERGRSTARLRCYLHTSHYAKQGWYVPAEKEIVRRHAFAG